VQIKQLELEKFEIQMKEGQQKEPVLEGRLQEVAAKRLDLQAELHKAIELHRILQSEHERILRLEHENILENEKSCDLVSGLLLFSSPAIASIWNISPSGPPSFCPCLVNVYETCHIPPVSHISLYRFVTSFSSATLLY
jgi:hypothetical protein